MVKKTFLIILAIAVSLFAKTPEEAAKEGLVLLENIKPNFKELMGFAKSDDLSKATVGEGINLYEITPQSVNEVLFSKTMVQTDLWLFPVKIAGQSKVFLLVDKMDGEYKAVSLRNPSLAREIEKIQNFWVKEKKEKIRFVQNLQSNEFLFHILNNTENLTPIIYSKNDSRSANYQSPFSSQKTISDLKVKIDNNIKSFGSVK